MSEENVAIYRRLCEEFQQGSRNRDWEPWLEGLDAALARDVEWDASGLPIPGLSGVYRGPEAVVNWWREWLSAWETSEFDYELLDAGDRVVLLVSQTMRGRSTGIEVSIADYAHIVTFRDGLITHWTWASQREALAAAAPPPTGETGGTGI